MWFFFDLLNSRMKLKFFNIIICFVFLELRVFNNILLLVRIGVFYELFILFIKYVVLYVLFSNYICSLNVILN